MIVLFNYNNNDELINTAGCVTTSSAGHKIMRSDAQNVQ